MKKKMNVVFLPCKKTLYVLFLIPLILFIVYNFGCLYYYKVCIYKINKLNEELEDIKKIDYEVNNDLAILNKKNDDNKKLENEINNLNKEIKNYDSMIKKLKK